MPTPRAGARAKPEPLPQNDLQWVEKGQVGNHLPQFVVGDPAAKGPIGAICLAPRPYGVSRGHKL